MNGKNNLSHVLAAEITRSASKQTYYIIRFFVDRELINDAYRAYGYFRWVDDVLDIEPGAKFGKISFVKRQKLLLEACYRGEAPDDLCPEEWMLFDLVRNDTEKNSGLQTYLRNMMEIMDFDTQRRNQVISQAELSEYSRKLAMGVTEAMHYFIGHNHPTPAHEDRYLAVTAAHITHMLRDALEDTDIGYFNIPSEYLQSKGIKPYDVESLAYREWVCERVQLASSYFKIGKEYIAHIKSLRCRLAGYAYIARFEWVLRAIEHDNYCLKPDYSGRKSLGASLWMGWITLASLLVSPWIKARSRHVAV
jgi:phytoene/squalene synthetase